MTTNATVAKGHKSAGRRVLKYESLDAIMPDVDRLLQGHQTVGNWSLGQICNHLTFGILGSLEGYRAKPLPGFLRATVGRLILSHMLKSETIREGVWLPKKDSPKPGLDARAEAEALRAALGLLVAEPEPKGIHPFFGKLTRDQWDRFHRIHCAHHLSFAVPTG